MRRLVCLLLLGGSACGSDTGILVVVTQDAASRTRVVDELRFVIGVEQPSGMFLAEEADGIYAIDRDLTASDFRLLVHDRDVASPTAILVAVIGSSEGVETAFGGFAAPQRFLAGRVVERDVVLVEGAPYRATATSCVSWGENRIVARDDRDCDGDPVATDCDDADPARASLLPELCGNGVDEDCDGAPDDGCTGPCADGERRACYTGPAGTQAAGVCRTGLETCVTSAFTTCVGEVVPSGAEACNGLDDDCDGAIDEGLPDFTCGLGACLRTVPSCAGGALAVCTPEPPLAANDATCDGVDDDCDGAVDEDCPCTRVTTSALGGSDAEAAASANATPFATVQAAIDWAAADPGRPQQVCLASGVNCGATAVFAGPVTMRNGISVYGRYRTSDWTRCGPAQVAILDTGTATGVLFPSAVTEVTVLDGVHPTFAVVAGAPAVAAVTVEGARGVLLSNLVVDGDVPAPATYGVNLVGDGRATITRSSIFGGAGTGEAVGVRSLDSRPTIVDNCTQLDGAGRCQTWCDASGATLGLRGRATPGAARSYAVLLEGSSDASIERSSICHVQAQKGAGILIKGEAGGVLVRGNFVAAEGGSLESAGILLVDCAGTAPWIVDNREILAHTAAATAQTDAIHSLGDCRPIIDANLEIRAGDEGGSVDPTGIRCEGGSACDILANTLIAGASAGAPPQAAAIRCLSGSCGRVVGNGVVGSLARGASLVGIELDASAPLVAQNEIAGGCPSASGIAVGVLARDSWSRLENNRIAGGACDDGAAPFGMGLLGLDAVTVAPGRELDVHSNRIDAGGNPVVCSGFALRVEGRGGRFRNNIVSGGLCQDTWGVVELSPGGDPRVFEHNVLDPAGASAGLYLDEATTALTIGEINSRADMVTSGNLAVDPLVDGTGHLQPGSQCIDAGTDTDAPAVDMDGEHRPRGARVDIGPDEF